MPQIVLPSLHLRLRNSVDLQKVFGRICQVPQGSELARDH